VLSDRLTPPNGARRHALYPIPPAAGAQNHNRLQTTGTLMDGSSFAIKYGDNTSASGLVSTDTVVLLSPSSTSASSQGSPIVTATAQAVGAATSVADRFWTQGSDGILGMGFAAANTVTPVKQRTFFDNIRGALKQPVFTAWLQRGTSGGAGAYDFGWIDRRKYRVRFLPFRPRSRVCASGESFSRS
jgi:hypothetical protein